MRFARSLLWQVGDGASGMVGNSVEKYLEPHEFRFTLDEQRNKEMNLFARFFHPEAQTKPPASLEKEVSADNSRTLETRDSTAAIAGIGSTDPSLPLSPTASTNDSREAAPHDEGSQEPADEFDGSELPSWMRRNKKGLTVDLDALPPRARASFEEELVAQNKVPLFVGDIKHAYTKAAVGKTDICPLCKSPMENKCAHFIYATNVASRVMLAPAGFFCTRCPTVIVDESILATGMKPGLQFRGVVGINFGGRKEDCLFSTFNGRKPLYILDEERGIMGISITPLPLGLNNPNPGRALSAQKKKRKRQLAKQARRRNRKR